MSISETDLSVVEARLMPQIQGVVESTLTRAEIIDMFRGPQGEVGPMGPAGHSLSNDLDHLVDAVAMMQSRVDSVEEKLQSRIDVEVLRASDGVKISLAEAIYKSLSKEKKAVLFNKLNRTHNNIPTICIEPIGEHSLYKVNDLKHAAKWLTDYIGYTVVEAKVEEALQSGTELVGCSIYYEYEENTNENN